MNRKKLLKLEKEGKYVFHGSRKKLNDLEPQQAYRYNKISGKMEKDGKPAVFATPHADIAIFRAIINKDEINEPSKSQFGIDNNGKITFSATENLIDSAEKKRGVVYVLERNQFQDCNSIECRSFKTVQIIESIEVGKEDLPKNIKVLKEDISVNDEKIRIIEDFYNKILAEKNGKIKKISLKDLAELKEKGVSTENFLDYLSQNHEFLLHGSIQEIEDGHLKSKSGKIFATNRAAIAIMRSLYSNRGVNLSYPYFIHENSPLVLNIHTKSKHTVIHKNHGFVYLIKKTKDFKNEPKSSWQFVKDGEEIEFSIIVEIEKSDFQYPVEIYESNQDTVK